MRPYLPLAQEVELRLYTALPALGHPRNSISAELEFVFTALPRQAFLPPATPNSSSAPMKPSL